MGCGSSADVASRQQSRLKCARHPNTELSYYEKRTGKLFCQDCRYNASNPRQLVQLRAFINSDEYSNKVKTTLQGLSQDIREVKELDKNVANKGVEIKQRINDYIEDIVKFLRQLKSDLYCDAERTVQDYRKSLQKRNRELDGFHNIIKVCRSRNNYDGKVTMLKTCSEYERSQKVDPNLTYSFENNAKIEEWQRKHDIILQSPNSVRSGTSARQPVSLSDTVGSESFSFGSDDSGHLIVGIGSRATASQSTRRVNDVHTGDVFSRSVDHRAQPVNDLGPGYISRTNDGPISTARLSKIQVASALECVKTLSLSDRQITCAMSTRSGCVVFCDQLNSELLLLDPDLKPLRSKHLTGRPQMVWNESMRNEEWIITNYKRNHCRDSTLSYDELYNPKCFAIDDADNMFFVEKDSSKVHMVSGAGIYRGVALMEESNIEHISYLPRQKAFLVVTQRGERVDMYRAIGHGEI